MYEKRPEQSSAPGPFYQTELKDTDRNRLKANELLKPAVLSPGVGMDCCVIPLRHGGLSLVQTTDFFYPLVEDPYMMVS